MMNSGAVKWTLLDWVSAALGPILTCDLVNRLPVSQSSDVCQNGEPDVFKCVVIMVVMV